MLRFIVTFIGPDKIRSGSGGRGGWGLKRSIFQYFKNPCQGIYFRYITSHSPIRVYILDTLPEGSLNDPVRVSYLSISLCKGIKLSLHLNKIGSNI